MNKALKAAKRVLPVYRQTVDGWAQGIAEADEAKKQISCKRGCHHCCFNLVKATLAEGAAVAAHLVETDQFEKYRPQLEKTARLATSVVDSGDEGSFRYLASKTPCAFLKDGECSVYDLRPMSCRTYYVATSPDNCSPDRPGAEVGVVDARVVAGVFLTHIVKATHPHIPAFIGDFPSTVLSGKELIERSPSSFKRWLQKSEFLTSDGPAL